ncbi:serine/threonine protein kinase [Anaerocolumna jejuensis DSM 15929]|uniref:Serine/threonine protein kinase n=1 Tax=Anaerocolumna jejuensis DSM 15929 TaxID=1121322 RepID=A0A1M6V1X6_9FIRM|nr:serine/threonine-protein kinase [Anaerocolumna jejuensis]SHK75453.1 serine/threonine protein kinase [Anaerocolumna jejuensis DSM 15929]
MNKPVWFDKYRIIKALGKGGSAEVFLAEHRKLASLCAIKRIHKGNPLHQQLLQEAVILKSLSHPCIPVIYDFEEDKEYSYIIEQYMEGILLKDFLKEEGRLKESLVVSIGTSICSLFLYLYSLDNPVLYLDLNPGNIILNKLEVKLIDFGACVYKEKAEERKFSLGTRGFFAPELKTGSPDERSDVYAIGALLYYLIMGGVSFKSGYFQPDAAARKLYSAGLLRIIQRASRYHSAFRYLSVAQLNKKLLSEQNRKLKGGHAISGESIKVAIAGVQSRIGVTHLALLLAGYLNSKGVKCLYMEKNPTGHLRAILNSRKGELRADGIWHLKEGFFLPFSQLSTTPLTEGFQIILYDFGTAFQEGRDEFNKADIRLLVAGTKDWEVESWKEAEDNLKPGSSKILLNFLSGKQFRDFCREEKDNPYYRQYNCRYYRIPYEPDPFSDNLSQEMKDFLEELLDKE